MDQLRKEILVTFQGLMRNLGLEYQIDDVNYLAQDDLYLEIFATMFPMLRESIEEIASEPENEKGERIQSLIEFLSTEILNLDLSHIRGALIADGDLKHILNFLQLLLEISKMFLQKRQGDEEYSEEDGSRGRGRTHSEGGEPHDQGDEEYEGYGDEEEDLMGDHEYNTDPNVEEVMDILNRPKKGHEYASDRERTSGGRQPPPGSQSDGVSRISEVSKSKESSEYESYNKKFSSQQKHLANEERASQQKKGRSFEKQGEDYERYDYGYGEQPGEGEYGHEEYEEEQREETGEVEGQIDPEDLRYDVEEKDYMRLVQRGSGTKQKAQEQYQREQYEEQRGQKGTVSQKRQTGKSKTSSKKAQLRPLHQTPYGQEQAQPIKPKKSVKIMKKQGKLTRPKTAGARQQRRVEEVEEHELHHSGSKKHLETIDEMTSGKHGMEHEEEHEEEEGQPEEGYEQPQGSQYGENAGDQHNIPGMEGDVDMMDENMLYSILSKNIKHVRANLENLRSSYLPDDEPKTQQLILQQKNTYKAYLNRYLNEHRIKENKQSQAKNVNEKNFAHSVKAQILNDQKVDEVLDNQQKSLFLKLRDEKINYLRKIHKIVFELEKKKLIEERKEQLELRKAKNQQTRLVVESIQNMYKNKLDLLREKQINDEQERKLVQNAQKKMLRDLQKEIKSNKMKEIEMLKNKWNCEKEKFESLMHDNGYLEEKIMKVYKRFN